MLDLNKSTLSVCDKLEETTASALTQSESLRQSILNQAFEGKLVAADYTGARTGLNRTKNRRILSTKPKIGANLKMINWSKAIGFRIILLLALPKELPSKLLSSKTGDKLEIPSQIQFADLIILSQSCDLAQDKVEQVLLCAHFPASLMAKTPEALFAESSVPLFIWSKNAKSQGANLKDK